MIRVVLVDDHELVRTGFRMILAQQAGIEVVGEAADGEHGLALIRSELPDVALVDVHMPRLSGIELTDRVRKHKLSTRVVILTVVSEAPFPRRLIEAGASGYLTKGCAADELVRAVRQVADGRRYLSPDIAEVLALGALDGGESPFEVLSARELDVAMMLARGQDMQLIADKLKLSAKTVATYKYRLFDKLGVDNPVALAHLAHTHGLLDDRTRALSD
ncbi:response regulator [Dokdonella fugitiva]|jgi:DNA-binding NarL/FixJ family response regulator|uniref:DNA-binding NarL/FixJ family response regulator n=1 Tax=Dokdonella fugitiva TaxID=328517 RepID=A0A4R2I7G1_9GAMM|nr:response regulator [Dokdonella fugitiva]MBA8883270.1 DNA-binding NarL/FixJ family response regulator [Dokdonella fugitiva]TCO40273.1 DNA-binding NarL/FixJ family response regulator [Dokdonella fugitiva]